MTKLAIVSGGLREPSSTRLLADRLGAGGRDRAGRAGHRRSTAFGDRTAPAGAADHGRDADRVRAARAGGRLRDGRQRRRAHRRDPGVQRLVQRTVQVASSTCSPRSRLSDMPVLIAATGGTERHSLGARARVASDVLLPARDRLPDRGVRRHRRLRRPARLCRARGPNRHGGRRLRPARALMWHPHATRRVRRATGRDAAAPRPVIGT